MEKKKNLKEKGEKKQKISSPPCESSSSFSEWVNEEEDSVVQKKVRIISKAVAVGESRKQVGVTRRHDWVCQIEPKAIWKKMSQHTIQVPQTQADQKM